jgi:ankyrin repeat protein
MADCLGRNTPHRWLDWLPRPDKTDLIRLRELLDLKEFEYVNTQDILGRTPLHIVCESGWVEGVELLLSRGANPRAVTVYRSLPLHYAAVQGFLQICRLLIGHCDTSSGAGSRDWQGKTAVDYACARSHTAVARFLAPFYP